MFMLIGLTIPSYLLLFPLYRVTIMLHLQNTYLSLILPLTATSISFNTLLFVGFLRDFPEEIEEAAIIDGAGQFKIFTSIIFPLVKPCTTTVAIFIGLSMLERFPHAAANWTD